MLRARSILSIALLSLVPAGTAVAKPKPTKSKPSSTNPKNTKPPKTPIPTKPLANDGHLSWVIAQFEERNVNGHTAFDGPKNLITYSSSGDPITVHRVANGIYQVRFDGQAPDVNERTAYHVVSMGSDRRCTYTGALDASQFGREGQYQIDVTCKNPAWGKVGSPFAVLFYRQSDASHGAHRRGNQSGGTTWNSRNNASITMDVFDYEDDVKMAQQGTYNTKGAVLVTSGGDSRCHPIDWDAYQNSTAVTAIVKCDDGYGNHEPGSYAVSYFANTIVGTSYKDRHHGAWLVADRPTEDGASHPEHFSTTGTGVTVDRKGTGRYTVRLGGFGEAAKSLVMPTAFADDRGPRSPHCTPDSMPLSWKGDTIVSISCRRPNGDLVDVGFSAIAVTDRKLDDHSPPQKVAFECKVEGNNDGCTKTVSCPEGQKISSVKAACNLESGSVSDAELASMGDGQISIVRESDGWRQGLCKVGPTQAKRGNKGISWTVARETSIEVSCTEKDKNGGDCHVRGELTCQ